ncbi:MAG: cupin domain-containing protein [Verrucomicrobiota bacterium]
MQPSCLRPSESGEVYFHEGCHILEMLNHPAHPELSIARARVRPGVRTRRHRLRETSEHYVLQAGTGRMFLGDDPEGHPVRAGDVVVIPAGVDQAILNTGAGDLVFLALCHPRFVPEAYEDTDPRPAGEPREDGVSR